MNSLIQEILQDLYKLDPTIMEKQEQIVPIIEKLIELKPEIQIDDEFKLNLKNQLLEKIRNNELSSIDTTTITSTWFWHSLKYFFSWVVVSALMFAVIFQFIKPTQNNNIQTSTQLSYQSSSNIELKQEDTLLDKSSIVSSELDAMTGSLKALNEGLTGWSIITGEKNSSSQASTQVVYKDRIIVKNIPSKSSLTESVSNSSSNDSKIQIAFESNIKKSTANSFWALNIAPQAMWKWGDLAASAKAGWNYEATSEKMIAADTTIMLPVVYEYKYVWTGFSLPSSTMEVYKRQVWTLDTSSIANLVKWIDFGKIDLNWLQSLNVDNITLSEDKSYWLQLNIWFKEWSISFWQNYDKWPQSNCSTPECYEKNRIKITDWPTDEKLLNISNGFMKQYWVNLDGYWTWFVDNAWKQDYEKATNKNDYYVPEIASIIYPLTIKWKDIYEEYGNRKWITVNVDIKSMKVSWLNWIESISYIASDYNVDTNISNILKVAQAGWRWGLWINYESSVKIQKKEVQIWNPRLEYVNVYDYKNGQSIQYVIPALIFPTVTKPSETDYFSSQVVVPLIKDFYEYDNSGVLRGIYQSK